MIQKKVLCAVAGSSGGHIIPGIVAMRSLEDQASQVLFFTTASSIDRSLAQQYSSSFTYCALPIEQVPGKRIWRYPLFFYRFIQSFIISFLELRAKKPASVMSMGGLVSLPVCWAAWFLKIDVILFELNAVPGKAVRWLAPCADKVQVCFEEAGDYFDKKKVLNVPYPHRFTDEKNVSQEVAREHLGIDPARKTILILGGSQGSYAINQLIKCLVEDYPYFAQEVTIIHQTGASLYEQKDASSWFTQFYKQRGVRSLVFDFNQELHYCYLAADIIIMISGAGTLFVIEHFNKRALLIPLEHAQGHQVDNALAMIKRHSDLFTMIRQHHAYDSIPLFYDKIKKMLSAELK